MNRMFALIGPGIKYKSQEVMKQLYRTWVRPFGVLCAVLVFHYRGRGGFGESAGLPQ